MKVLKFGGSCLSDAEGVRKVAKSIMGTSGKKVVVLSAIKDATDLLLSYLEDRSRPKLARFRELHMDLARGLMVDGLDRDRFSDTLGSEMDSVMKFLGGEDEAVPGWVHDRLLTCGERLSVKLMGLYLESRGIKAVPLMSEDAQIMAKGEHGNAEADLEATREPLRDVIFPLLTKDKVPVVTGFYGVLPDGRAATFGRNGSDYSAAVVARALKARELVLYKDVKGFMSADPAVVPDAKVLGEITYDEAIELSCFGAKVMHPMTFGPLAGTGIDVRILDMEDDGPAGTLIVGSREGPAGEVGVAFKKGVTCIRLSLTGIRPTPEVLSSAYDILSRKGLNVISMVASQTSIGIMVPTQHGIKALTALENDGLKGVQRVRAEGDLAIIGLVGGRLGGEPDILGRCLLDLAAKGIGTRMSGSGGTDSAYYLIVDEKVAEEAVRTAHATFWG